MHISKLITAFWVGFFHVMAIAAVGDSAFLSIPSRFQSTELSTSSRGLGETCLSRSVFPDGSICNPAFLGESDASNVGARLFIGNGYQALTTANTLVAGSINRAFLETLFQSQTVTSFEGNIALSFITKGASAEFSPYRLQYASEIHNPAYPVAAIHASLERRFRLGLGSSLSDLGVDDPILRDFSVGTQLSFVQRKFIHSSFAFAQLATEIPANLVPIQSQTLFLINPTLGWKKSTPAVVHLASFQVKNLGFKNNPSLFYPNHTDMDVGYGLEPALPIGHLKVGIEFSDLVHGVDVPSRAHFGTSYRYGIIEPMFGATSRSLTAGCQFGFELMQAGIVYEFIRNDFDDGQVKNRIATEVSIRL